jgi:hypothetical protein
LSIDVTEVRRDFNRNQRRNAAMTTGRGQRMQRWRPAGARRRKRFQP